MNEVEDILITNIEINRVNCLVFNRTGSHGRSISGMHSAPTGEFKRIGIDSDMHYDNLNQGSFISGIKDGIIDNVIVRNMDISMEGGVDYLPTEVRENEKGYPDAHQFDNPLPSYGFFVRHAKNITLENINVTPLEEDKRPLFSTGGNNENVLVNGVNLTD